MALTVAGSDCRERVDVERPVEADLHEADLLALLVEILDRLVGGLGARAHDHDDALRVGRADVVEEVVLPADELRELVQRLLDDARAGVVELVDRLAPLEIHVGVLGGSAHHRVVRRQRALPVRRDEVVVDHRPHVVEGELLDLVHFVRGAEAVEEVQNGTRDSSVAACAMRVKSMTS